MNRSLCDIERRQQGATLLELALVAPVLILLIAAVFDLNQALQHKRLAVDASRHGARAATQALDIQRLDPFLSDDFGLLETDSCSKYLSAYTLNTPVSAVSYAKLLTCRYLKNWGGDPDGWEVQVNASKELLSTLTENYELTRLSVNTSRKAATCFFCLGPAKTLLPSASAEFFSL